MFLTKRCAVTAPLARALRTPILTPVVLIGFTLVLAFDPMSRLARADAQVKAPRHERGNRGRGLGDDRRV